LAVRIFFKSLVALLVALCLVYLGDWGVWRVRVAHGGGMGKVTVSRFVVAPLKGNKEEYYYDGTQDVACSQSMFPQSGGGACWWMAKHATVFDR
jgi:hypothetical protein